MNALDDCLPDIMQVCRNGHVITDLLKTCPERGLSHCDRCGAPTIELLPDLRTGIAGGGAGAGHGAGGPSETASLLCWLRCRVSLGRSSCRPAVPSSPLVLLETLLRRLPRAIRQFRSRHGRTSPFPGGGVSTILKTCSAPCCRCISTMSIRKPARRVIRRTVGPTCSWRPNGTAVVAKYFVAADLHEAQLPTNGRKTLPTFGGEEAARR